MITVTDLFCGAGGSSTGAETVPGVVVRMAANHWKLAIETHNTNLPHVDHDCADISQVDPRRYPHTDILWASPECTNHSQAKGRKRLEATPDLFGDVLPDEAAERSRATMWDVVRFTERHRYRAIIIENVVDAYHWLPFKAWLMAMDSLGYDHRLVWLNSMHAQAAGMPAPQSRDRMYVVFWRKGDRAPDVDRWTRPRAWCPVCETVVQAIQVFKRDRKQGRYRQQYVYRCPNVSCRNTIVEPGWLPAAAAIDWTLPGERIGDRIRPLAPKTVKRIEAGLRKYARPTLVPVEGRDGKQATPVDDPARTQTARNETGVAIPPLLVPAGGTWNDTATSVEDPFRTRTTRDTEAVTFPPFIAELRGGGSKTRPVANPLATVTAAGNHHALVMRNNSSRGDGGEMSTPVTEVVRTITTRGHQSLVSWAALYGYDSGQMRSTRDVLPTQTTVGGDALLTADQLPDVEDCYFRMLEPHEIAAAMAFPSGYVLLGNKREKVRLAGNAVTPPAARDLIAAVAEALNGKVVAS